MNSRDSIALGMCSLQTDRENHIRHINDIKKSHSYNCLYARNKVKEEKEEEDHFTGKHSTGEIGDEQQLTEQETAKIGMLQESNTFMFKTIFLLILICLPGNIFAASIFYKHIKNHLYTVEQSNLNDSYSSIAQIKTTEDDLSVKEIKETKSNTETVSKNKNVFWVSYKTQIITKTTFPLLKHFFYIFRIE